MQFWCAGRSYQTNLMRQFLTDDPQVPVILMTRDNRRVFVLRSDGAKGCRVDQANTLEIISLASRYDIKELLDAYPAPHVGPVRLELVPA
jgi:hypothetical protein